MREHSAMPVTGWCLSPGIIIATSIRAEIMKHIDLFLVGRTVCFQRDEVILLFFILFCNMNLLISFYLIFHTIFFINTCACFKQDVKKR
jgi:ABC-type Mn2+/Zn2+ transport system permease subunit